MKHRYAAIALAGVAALTLAAGVAGADYQGFRTVNVVVNGKTVQSDVPAINFYGRTMLPVRAIANAVGADVKWDQDTQTASLSSQVTPDQYAAVQADNARLKAEASAATDALQGYLKASKPGAPMPANATSANGLVLTLNSLVPQASIPYSYDPTRSQAAPDGKLYVVVDVSIYNGTSTTVDINPAAVTLQDNLGYVYQEASVSVDQWLQPGDLAPAKSVRGRIAYLIPKANVAAAVAVAFYHSPFDGQQETATLTTR